MLSTACILLLVLVVAGGLLATGWHIIGGILHFVFSLFRALFHLPILLLVLIALVAIWILFIR